MSNKSIYQISYDLQKVKDYPSLYKAIEKLGPNVRLLESFWLVLHPGSAIQIRDHLKTIVDNDDMLFVCKIEQEDGGAYNLPKEGKEWLMAHADWVPA
ncbi:MAG: hypothetical protein V4495_19805 [Pseudomonadota bacterium]